MFLSTTTTVSDKLVGTFLASAAILMVVVFVSAVGDGTGLVAIGVSIFSSSDLAVALLPVPEFLSSYFDALPLRA